MSFYPRLPDELKLNIWEKASLPAGVHRFTMRTYDDNSFLGIEITPMRGTFRSDPSAWRAREVLGRVDGIAAEVAVQQIRNGTPHVIELSKTPNRQGVVPHRLSRPRVAIDAANDLVHFEVIGEVCSAEIAPLNPARRILRPTRVAIDFKKPRISANDYFDTFSCVCDVDDPEEESHKALCPIKVAEFIAFFPELEVFYIAVKLHLRSVLSLKKRGTKRAHDGQAVENASEQEDEKDKVSVALEKFRRAARLHNLDVFQDSEYTYYEVRECDTGCLAADEYIWDAAKGTEVVCQDEEEGIIGDRRRREAFRCKVLVYCETERPANTSGRAGGSAPHELQ
ncbi:hypothetical protein GGS23DRAFT_565357 [Durotheca rogersii]|uniref:uncharacterized protein n=1 Tax=Durotheca rogersii TaxID=419775 RepID=UPI00221ECB9D|nr:uncharacterized protein GGS23DRAFT_565357 [Durotheca rogersii]KAI5863788.1 hypothetical protein GGS23DRAFT_565357 [Durotheca rogersii]